MSSIMRCRSGLVASSVMGDAPVLMKVANPSSQDRTPHRAIPLAVSPAAGPYRASGLVHWRKAAARQYEPFPIPVRASWTGLYWNVGFALGGMMPTFVFLVSGSAAQIPTSRRSRLISRPDSPVAAYIGRGTDNGAAYSIAAQRLSPLARAPARGQAGQVCRLA